LALSTIYGADTVHEACREMLKSGIIGVGSLEILLRAQHRDELLQPEPLAFQNQKLNRAMPVVDLRRYDARLLESQEQRGASREEENNGNNHECGEGD